MPFVPRAYQRSNQIFSTQRYLNICVGPANPLLFRNFASNWVPDITISGKKILSHYPTYCIPFSGGMAPPLYHLTYPMLCFSTTRRCRTRSSTTTCRTRSCRSPFRRARTRRPPSCSPASPPRSSTAAPTPPSGSSTTSTTRCSTPSTRGRYGQRGGGVIHRVTMQG